MFKIMMLAAIVVGLTGCGGRAFMVSEFDDTTLRDRASSQTEDDIIVSAAVPGPEETRQIFGIDLYAQGTQPVWLEIENQSESAVRFAPVGTDREYFSPLEVSYKNRSGYSDEARAAMDRRFYQLAMPRRIEAGATASGFVMTHAESGTKGFNVDVFGQRTSSSFTFFVTIPGFEPDHASMDFASLYEPGDEIVIANDAIYKIIKDLDCCTASESGQRDGAPLNVVFVGKGLDILYSLLRAGWVESESKDVRTYDGQRDYFFDGRKQDAVFRYEGRNDIDGFYELRVWLSPMKIDDSPVWTAQLRHFVDHRWKDPSPDPDVDSPLWFLIQNLWYSETLLRYGWVNTAHVASIAEKQIDFQGTAYFTGGGRAAIWLTGEPVAMSDVEVMEWDTPVEAAGE